MEKHPEKTSRNNSKAMQMFDGWSSCTDNEKKNNHTLLSSHLRIFQQKTKERKVSDLFEELSCDSEVCTDPASLVWVGKTKRMFHFHSRGGIYTNNLRKTARLRTGNKKLKEAELFCYTKIMIVRLPHTQKSTVVIPWYKNK